ncbi:MAG: transposase, partial [Planctomycetaceae bacterium]|nr:transposase [Planctomycetaceae bacterium]
MPRSLRVNLGGFVYHVLNRSNGRQRLFRCDEDYPLFLDVLAAAHERVAMRTIGYCVMPNHWHLLLWPRDDGDLSAFVRWLTLTHTQRVHARRGTAGAGHIYQGRFKSFLIEQTRPPAALRAMGVLEGGDAVLSVLRYVERNAVKVGLASRAEAWPWCSAHARLVGGQTPVPLTPPPGGLPQDWLDWVNRPHSDKELAALQRCIERGVPFGREP